MCRFFTIHSSLNRNKQIYKLKLNNIVKIQLICLKI